MGINCQWAKFLRSISAYIIPRHFWTPLQCKIKHTDMQLVLHINHHEMCTLTLHYHSIEGAFNLHGYLGVHGSLWFP